MIPLRYFCMLLLVVACEALKKETNNVEKVETPMKSISQRFFATTPNNDTVTAYTLTNASGMRMEVINYGGIVLSLHVPDREGKFEDVVLGFDSLEPYLNDSPYFGALVGRYGNRIAKGQFALDGETFELVRNNIGNHLHGGTIGFDKVIWEANPLELEAGPAVKLSYTSKDGEEGYPGNLKVEVIYTLREDNALQIDYEATTDKSTVVNLTQHSYFNLNPESSNILDHQLVLHALEYLPVDETLIPLGTKEQVVGTPLDFTTPALIGTRINEEHLQLVRGGGYDHCWILQESDGLKPAAQVFESSTGRLMTVSTTEPGIQFYSGNFLDGSLSGKEGVRYGKRSGLCLETQHFPDSPNQPNFPSVRLDPGQKYTSTTVYAFGVKP